MLRRLRALSLSLPLVCVVCTTVLRAAADEGGRAGAPRPAGSTTATAEVSVVAPPPGGPNVTDAGCTRVIINGTPTLVGPGGGPCPQVPYAPHQPYAPAPYGAYYYGPPPDYRPPYAPDSDRAAALLLSSLVFGVGGVVAGTSYLVRYSNAPKYDKSSTQVPLLAYAAIVTITPSIPRFLLGDATRGLIYTALRGGAFASAVLIDWGRKEDAWMGPFLLGFCAPIALGLVDLVTTPHREDLEEKPSPTAGVKQVTPIALVDHEGRPHGALLGVGGVF